ncbi:MAG: peptidyl-prolyl cis-trans isomerase [Desulfobacteraceae bacterium 4572_130]|nr:MAG: peptidyl-prolyl cis-trans isomerase [Desulfobacteraceae bacterium 4572_130]
MLGYMRKNTESWIIKILLGLIVLVFVFLGMGSIGSKRRNSVAMVNDKPITMEEYKRSYHDIIENMRQRFGDNLNDEIIKMFQVKKQALDSLIEERLLTSEAEKLKIKVSKQEVRDLLVTIPAFKKNSVFDFETYKMVLANNRISPEIFEEMQKKAIIQNKVRSFVLGSITVSDMELDELYKYENTQVAINYIKFDPDSYTNIKPGKKEIKEYYNKNKNNYKSDPMIKVEFIRFSPDDYKNKVNISKQDLKAYYNENIDKFKTPEKVQARHILIKVDENAGDKDIEDKRLQAEKIYAKVLKNKNFAMLAKKYSQGPTKETGGYLGLFTKNDMIKPFAEKAFSMKPGEISKPVKTRFGWHIIKLEKKIKESITLFKDVKQDILRKFKKDKKQNLAYYDAGKAFDAIIDGDDLEQAALITNKKVLKAGPFAKQDNLPFASTAFSLNLLEISDIKEIGDSYYIIKPIEKIESKIFNFDKVKKIIQKDLKAKMKLEKAKNQAENFLGSLKKNKDFKTIAKQKKLKINSSGFFFRGANIPELGNSSEIVKASFELSRKKSFYLKPIKVENNFYVIFLKDKKIIKDNSGKNREMIKQSFMQTKQNKVYKDWIKELKKQGKIEIKKDFFK